MYRLFLHSLIKMLYWMSESSGSIVTKAQLLHAVKRNFSGYDEIDSINVFKENLKTFREFDVRLFFITSSNIL